MADIMKTWERSNEPSTFSRLTRAIKRPQPLREKISFTVYKLKVQQGRLEQAYNRMQKHYDSLFRKCTNAVLAKDTARASIYANECAEIRKMCQIILRSQFAIEHVEMGPVAGVIGSIKGNLAGVVPEVSYRLGEIGNTLNDLVMESGGATASSWSVVTTSDDAEKILADANVIAEQKMKDKFPTLPSPTLPSLEEST